MLLKFTLIPIVGHSPTPHNAPRPRRWRRGASYVAARAGGARAGAAAGVETGRFDQGERSEPVEVAEKPWKVGLFYGDFIVLMMCIMDMFGDLIVI